MGAPHFDGVVQLDDGIETVFKEHNYQCKNNNFMLTRSIQTLERVGPYLAAMNEPQSTITTIDPPSKLLKKRINKGEVPFFTYREVGINRPKDEKGLEIRGNALQGRKGVALHTVKGHERVLPSGKSIWVKNYHRGDPQIWNCS